ncbi:hypothetical protein [Haloarchaeobius salinus]|uniref:hypothetical protein n=1 Tax=Haloarchaeobius salinus TaxID=1198298 RepID=UPI0021098A03|nr:hypothetical protein [Haloarchaeobius salinus]
MATYEASFDIDSRTDSYAALRILEQVYDAVREETRNSRDGGDDADERLQAFRTLREAAKRRSPGRLTVTYEQYDEEFED